jgi:hypothetical protein
MTWTYPRLTTGAWWTADVALELWVDADRNPVVIRLEGTLDGSTAMNVIAVVRELIDERACDIELRASALNVVRPSGVIALGELERLVRRRGGRLTRVGQCLEHPVPAPLGGRVSARLPKGAVAPVP